MLDASRIGELEKVEFLSRPASYPNFVTRVEVIETHMSWVFLAGASVYKFKKPVRRDFADFSTLAARWRNCEEEVRLNRRLAPDVYLDVVPLMLSEHATLQLDRKGEPVEWLVKMRRLAREDMLDAVIRAGAPAPEQLNAVARLLATFYREAAVEPVSTTEYLQRLATDLRDCVTALSPEIYHLDQPLLLRTAAALEDFLARAASTFEARVRAGRLVEGHGDLRPEHICLTPTPVIIDCLEFSRSLRIVDPIDELAYLALECEHAGAASVGATLLKLYSAASGDDPPPPLIAFHAATRSLLRAKLCAWHLADRVPAEHPRWLAKAASYLALAARHGAELRKP